MKKIIIFLAIVSIALAVTVEFDYEWDVLIGTLEGDDDGQENGCAKLTGSNTFGTIECQDTEGDDPGQTGSVWIYSDEDGVDLIIEIGTLLYEKNNLHAGENNINFTLEEMPPSESDIALKFSDLDTYVKIDNFRCGEVDESFDVMTGIQSASFGEIKATFK